MKIKLVIQLFLSFTLFLFLCTAYASEVVDEGGENGGITFTPDDWDTPKKVTVKESEETYTVVLDDQPTSAVTVNINAEESDIITWNEFEPIDIKTNMTESSSISTEDPFNYATYICLIIGIIVTLRGWKFSGGVVVAGSMLIIMLEVFANSYAQSYLKDPSANSIIGYVRFFYWVQVLNQIGIVLIGAGCLIIAMGKPRGIDDVNTETVR